MEKMDFTEKVFVLIDEENIVSEHESKEDAEKSMTQEDEENCVIICVSSDGYRKNIKINHKPNPLGSTNGKIYWRGKNISNAHATNICHKMIETYGNKIRDAANKKRELASGKKCA